MYKVPCTPKASTQRKPSNTKRPHMLTHSQYLVVGSIGIPLESSGNRLQDVHRPECNEFGPYSQHTHTHTHTYTHPLIHTSACPLVSPSAPQIQAHWHTQNLADSPSQYVGFSGMPPSCSCFCSVTRVVGLVDTYTKMSTVRTTHPARSCWIVWFQPRMSGVFFLQDSNRPYS